MRIVPALDRGLRILALLAERSGRMKVSEIAEVLELPRSATYELIHTLTTHQVIRLSEDGQVALGPQVFVLGGAYGRSLDFGWVAQETARELTQACDETVQVGTLFGRHVLYVAKADSPHPVRLVSTVGARLPAHCTALGKVLLAFLPPAELARRLDGVALESLTKRSITNVPALMRQFAEIRANAFGSEECESNPDVICVAAPVWDVQGHNVCAISISTPTARMNAKRLRELRALVIEGARTFSSRLGHSNSPQAGLRDAPRRQTAVRRTA